MNRDRRLDIVQEAAIVSDARRGRSNRFWTMRFAWPHDTNDYTFMGRAILAVGEYLPGWTGLEPGDLLMPPLDGGPYVQDGTDEAFAISLFAEYRPDLGVHLRVRKPYLGVMTPDDWLVAEQLYKQHRAERRARAGALMISLHNLFSAALAKGELECAARVSQSFRPLPPDWWIDEVINTKRFLECQTDPENSTVTHFPTNSIEAVLGDQSNLLYGGNAWLFITSESLAAFLAPYAQQPAAPATQRETKTFSASALIAAFEQFGALHPNGGREQWIKYAEAECGASSSQARTLWKNSTPAGGRKAGPKPRLH